MRRTTRRYVEQCAECQKSKPRAIKAYGLMQPIPPPQRPWQQITMDLITALPTTARGHDSMLVFVDRLSKCVRCVPTVKSIGAQETARLFKENIFRHHGLPEVIIADRDPRWNSLFWRSVFQSLGTQTRLSTAYHPQTDGQTERANRTIEEMLRSFVHPFGDDWDERISELEFAYNNSDQKSTKHSPFYLMHGFHPRTPIDLYNPQTAEETPVASTFVEQMLHAHQAAQASLEQASERQKMDYDRRRTRSSFATGDWVYLSSEHCKFQGRTDKLTNRFLGPFRIESMKANGLAATLKLPPSVKIHPTIHVSRLKAFRGKQPKETYLTPEPIAVEDAATDTRVVGPPRIDTVIAVRNVERANAPHNVMRKEFLVKWEGQDESSNSWVSLSALGKEKERALYLDSAGFLDEAEAIRKPR